jgi:endonuclease G
MNAERQVAYYTAVNVDGTKERPVDRDDFRDFWSGDPRVDPGDSLDNDAYRDAGGIENPLDRGHLVRRLDPCWGDDMTEVLGAHHDTFHWTNCSPQHKDFNRDRTTWGGVENHILRTANVRDLRVTVLTGPVFRKADPVYDAPTGVRVALPRDYWKVVAWVKEDGGLAATAFVISQRILVDDLVEMAFTAAFEQFQTTVRAVEEMTGLSFWQLAEHDPLAGSGADEAAPAAPPKVPLTSYGSIVL